MAESVTSPGSAATAPPARQAGPSNPPPSTTTTSSDPSRTSAKLDESTSVPRTKSAGSKQEKSGKTKASKPDATGEGSGGAPTTGGKDAKKEKRAAAVAARAAAAASSGGAGEAVGSASSGFQGQGQGQRGGPRPGQKGAPPGTTDGPVPSSSRPAPPALNQPLPSPSPPLSLLFSHLPRTTPPTTTPALLTTRIHPLIIRYCLLTTSGQIRGTNARTIGLMLSFKEVISGFECGREETSRALMGYLSPMIGWVEGCRPKGVGGGNAIRHLKSEISRISTISPLPDYLTQKRLILESIDEFLRDRIELAGEVISGLAGEKIGRGEVVVTYARSSIVEKVLLDAWYQMREEDPTSEFQVIVVDSGPLFEGKALLRVLQSSSIPCTYTLLPSLPSVLPRASLVLLGTAALLSDGAMYSRAGTAMVALLAKENRIPVVACCETYKFGEKVVLDAVTGNELGDTDWWTEPLIDPETIAKRKTKAVDVIPIHLLYDLTPAALITAVCTEVGFIPPSSVPTVIVKGDNSAL